MNIFATRTDPYLAARDHIDSHVLKMPIEYSQLLATAHRVLDGRPGTINHPRKGLIDYEWVLDASEEVEPILPLASHQNHPVGIWARECSANYEWLYQLYLATGAEFYRRYRQDGGPEHASMRHADRLQYFPENIPFSDKRTPFAMAMPDEFKSDNPVLAYRRYIIEGKRPELHEWREPANPPYWFTRYFETGQIL